MLKLGEDSGEPVFVSSAKIQLAEKGELYLKIKVRPKSGERKLEGIMADNTWKIKLKAPPERNLANLELADLLSDIFQVKRSNVVLAAGFAAPLKIVHIYK